MPGPISFRGAKPGANDDITSFVAPISISGTTSAPLIVENTAGSVTRQLKAAASGSCYDRFFVGGVEVWAIGANIIDTVGNLHIRNQISGATIAIDASTGNIIFPASVIPTTGLTAANAPTLTPFVTQKTGVDMKGSTPVVDIFTVRAGVSKFILTDCWVEVTATNTATLGPVFNVIESGASGVMTFGSSSTAGEATWIGTNGKLYRLSFPTAAGVQNIVGCATGNKVQLNITTGATATTLTATVNVTGYYE